MFEVGQKVFVYDKREPTELWEGEILDISKDGRRVHVWYETMYIATGRWFPIEKVYTEHKYLEKV